MFLENEEKKDEPLFENPLTGQNSYPASASSLHSPYFIGKYFIVEPGGDATIGNYAGGQGVFWDQSLGIFTISGGLSAGSIDIGGSDATSFHVDSLGNMWLGAATFAAAPGKISNAGVLTVTAAVIDGTSTLGGRLGSTLASAINSSGNLINDVINARLDSSAKQILSDFTLSSTNYAGALKSGTVTWSSTTGRITGGTGFLINDKGILGALAGVEKVIILNDGTATFAGELSAPTGTIGGFTINSNGIVATNLALISGIANVAHFEVGTGSNLAGMNSANAANDIAFWAGAAFANRATAPFRVEADGDMFGDDATFTGLLKSNTMKSYTCFETGGRFTPATGGATGSITYGTNGVGIIAGTTAGSFANLVWKTFYYDYSEIVFSVSIVNMNMNVANGSGSAFFGLGAVTVAGTGHTFTTDAHAGFKIIKSGGVVSLYATQSTGSGETVSSALTTLLITDTLDLILKVNGTSSIDYYWRKTSGALSAATNLNLGIPTGIATQTQFSTSNDNTGFVFDFTCSNSMIEK